MMDNRHPIITYVSVENCMPITLKTNIERELPQEGIEWKRPYRRQIKTVYLEAKFENANQMHDQSQGNDTGHWLKKQLLHTYWIECYDMDTYRSQIRDNLINWVNKAHRDADSEWLIVLLDHSDKRTSKSKLLPRSSMMDKIRADFPASLKPLLDRHMIILSDPTKSDSKSIDSFGQLLHRMRTLLLAAYSKQLVSYEEFIRAQREKRTSLQWDFFQFFLAQEELAFAFELLGLFDEALVQYDELDALFSQFVLNAHVHHVPVWLQQLANKCDSWNGLSLSGQSCVNLRSRLQTGNGNLLDLRNYLFARQCELLLLQHKPWEVALRSLQFLQNCVQELQILDIKLLDGAIPCWVYLSAYEILLKCERYNDSSQMDAYSRYTIGIRAYARKKLKELGHLCGLMPGMKPASDHLHHVVVLIAGMGEDLHLNSSTPSPQSRLKEALSSQEAFLKSYLEFSELTMGTFKHIGRLREARLIGKELSLLYFQMKKYQQSLAFLIDMEKMFMVEQWPVLMADTRQNILACYEGLNDQFKQLRYLLLLACSTLPEQQRIEYFDKAVQKCELIQSQNGYFTIRTDELFELKSLQLLAPKSDVNLNSTFNLQINLFNKLVKPLQVKRVVMILANGNGKSNAITSNVNANDVNVNQSNSVNQTIHDLNVNFFKLNLTGSNDQKPNLFAYNAATVGVKCVNTHKILKRLDSQHTFTLEKEPHVDAYEFAFVAENVHLNSGNNQIDLFLTCDESQHFEIKQMVIEWTNNVHLVGELQQPVSFDVHLQEPKLELNSAICTNLVAGIKQPIEFIFRNGSKAIARPITCKLTASTGIQFVQDHGHGHADDGHEPQPTLTDDHVHIHDRDLAAFEQFTISFAVIAEFNNLQKFSILNFDFDCEYNSGIDSTRDHNSNVNCKHLSITTHFLPPFVSVFNMHTCVDQKFIEIKITGSCEHIFELNNARIKFKCNANAFQLEPLFSADQCWTVFNGQIAHYVWRLTLANQAQADHQLSPTDQVDLDFLIDYQLSPHPTDQGELVGQARTRSSITKRTYSCAFVRSHFQTLYEINASVAPSSKSEFCRVGQLCVLHVTIKRTSFVSSVHSSELPANESLMYELVLDRSLWNPNGKTAGVLTGSDLFNCRLRFEVIPLASGFLPIPGISLSRYVSNSVCVEESKSIQVECTEDEESKISIASAASLSESKIIPFKAGQIYNHSRSRQVNVLPSSSLLPIDSSS